MVNGTERILVCCGKNCAASGALDVVLALEEELEKRGLAGEIKVIAEENGCMIDVGPPAAQGCESDASNVKLVRTGCMGECSQGPIVRFMPRDLVYYRATAQHVPAIVDSLLGQPVKKLLYKKKRQHFEKLRENPFYALQERIVLKHVGIVDPSSIDDYCANGGYQGLRKALDMTQGELLDALDKSGLRINAKSAPNHELNWHEAQGLTPRSIACVIGDEHDAIFGSADGTGVILAEGSPHTIIEGMTLCALALGATKGFIRIAQDNGHAYGNLQHALEEAFARGILGAPTKEFENEFNLALLGVDGNPSSPGACNAPTSPESQAAPLVIDVETAAFSAFVLAEGADRFSQFGTGGSVGTRVFSLTGKAKCTGIVEVPLSTTLRTLVTKIGGGVDGNRPLKAVQIGGFLGTCIPEPLLNMTIEPEALATFGIAAEATDVAIMDDRTCMVKTARNALSRLRAESRRIGAENADDLDKLLAILKDICEGSGEPDDIERLRTLCLAIRDSSSDERSWKAAGFLLSTIEQFQSEYEAHVADKCCPAGACPKLTQFAISPEACAGCDVCSLACPVEAILGEQREPHVIDQAKCISCGTCYDVCRFHAVLIERKPLANANPEQS